MGFAGSTVRKPIDLCGSFGRITSTLGLLRIFGRLNSSYLLVRAEASFDRLVLAQRHCCGKPNPGTRLPRRGVRYAPNTRCTPVPEVAIEREPEGGRLPTELLRVITQVTFAGKNRVFRLGLGFRNRKGLLVRAEEPYTTVAIKIPSAKTLRVAKLRLEGPAVNPPD